MMTKRKPEPPKFKPGDVVRLRSGGPPMTVTGYGLQTGFGAKRNRVFAARVKAERLRGVDRIVHVAFVSTWASHSKQARWFIDREEIHEDALQLCPSEKAP